MTRSDWAERGLEHHYDQGFNDALDSIDLSDGYSEPAWSAYLAGWEAGDEQMRKDAIEEFRR